MTDVLIIADTVRSPELRHEVPLAVPDPFFYAEVGGKRTVVVSSLESGRIAELGTGSRCSPSRTRASTRCSSGGSTAYALDRELYLGACKQLGLERAPRPPASRSATPITCARTGSSSPPTSASSTSAGG